MTATEAQQLGYRVIAASHFEVGLVQHDQGIRTWFSQSFDCRMPTLDHPLIQEAIRVNEEHNKIFKQQ